ncbi:hypothetical protein C2I36_07635 [Rhodobacteraceae bacterium WD3A24]|nr:hypothetical protein C2I36_07635 [Rhodobacteraceae bacterium WD3A24]
MAHYAFPAVLVAVDLALVGAHLLSLTLLGSPPHIANLDVEDSVPTWWASMQLLCAGVTIGLVALRGIARGRRPVALMLLAAGLVMMSADEVISVHERLGRLSDAVFGDRAGTAFHLTGLWFVVIGLPALAAIAATMVGCWRSLKSVPGTLVRLIWGFAILFLGAIGVEGLTNLLVDEAGYDVPRFMILVAFEEGFELLGGSLLAWAGVLFLHQHPETRPAFDALAAQGRAG